MPAFDDLISQIEVPQCTCLNVSKDHTLRHCLEAETRSADSMYLESDADEELLIQLKFMQAVRISAIIVQAQGDEAPKDIKLFVNKVGLDFDSAKDDKATQELSLSKAVVEYGEKTELRFVNFQGVQTLDIFVGSNQGDAELTRISKLAVLGEVVAQAGLKRSEDQQKAATAGDWGSSPKM